MNARPLVSLLRTSVVAAGLALALPLPGVAADNAPPEALNVKVFSDHYIVAGKQFTDLTALEAWAKPILVREVWLDFCDPVPTKQFMAAIERFHTAYPEGIQIRALSPEDERCVSAGESASRSPADMALARVDAEYLATDENGRSTLP